MALLLSRVGEFGRRAPHFSVRITLDYDRFWSQNLLQTTLTPTAQNPFKQYDWPNPPAGPAYPVSLRSWITQASIQPPAPADTTHLPRAPHFSTPRDYDRSIHLRTWICYNSPALFAPVQLPNNQHDWPLTPASPPIEQTVTVSYNKNLIGQDILPTGKDTFELVPREIDRSIQLRTWINSVNLALVTAPPQRPKNQYDWPLTPAAQQAAPTWSSWYNQNLIGQDRLPARQQDWPNPVPPARQPDLNNWLDRTKLQLIKPFLQSDWPLTPAPAPIRQTIAAWYNKNLIGQDQLPPGKDTLDLSPRDYERSIQLRTWISSVNLALVTTPPLPRPPFNQFDWPLTPAAQQSALSWTSWYNKNLIGKDQLPSRQQDWRNPTPFPLQPDLRTWIDRTKLLLRPLPFRQLDWPLTPAARQAALSWTAFYNLNLIGQDRLPVRQRDWPNPTRLPTATELRSFIGFLQRQPVVKPFKQLDWPLPQAPFDPYWLRVIAQARALYGGGVIPPAPPGIIEYVEAFLASYYGVFFAEQILPGIMQASEHSGEKYVDEVERGTVDLKENSGTDYNKAAK